MHYLKVRRTLYRGSWVRSDLGVFKDKARVMGWSAVSPREKVGERRLQKLEVRQDRLYDSRCFSGWDQKPLEAVRGRQWSGLGFKDHPSCPAGTLRIECRVTILGLGKPVSSLNRGVWWPRLLVDFWVYL